MDPYLLRIITQESESSLCLTVEGRLVGPWVPELSRAWTEIAPQLGQRQLSLDLRNVTYADAEGKAVLRAIVTESTAEVVASSPWTQYLASEITRSNSGDIDKEADIEVENRTDERLQEFSPSGGELLKTLTPEGV